MGGVISAIEPASIADGLGWKPGDEIIAINGHALSDVIDFRFYSSDSALTVLVRRADRKADYRIEKDPNEPLGVDFEDTLFDGVHTCGARCVFCFVDQLPKGLRPSLYLKDDDFRLSFLHGNFITLGNCGEKDLSRIVEQRLTPLYVSVHATEPEIRRALFGRAMPDILAQIETLGQGRIALHAQIVLCPGINDGAHLDHTVSDLATRHPTVASIAIVPAAVNPRFNARIPLTGLGVKDARQIVDKVEQWQAQFLEQKGTRLVWAADEFYLSAGRRVPVSRAYEGFPQIGNGVGLVRRFQEGAYRARRLLQAECVRDRGRPLTVSLVTGTLAAPLLMRFASQVDCDTLHVSVIPVRNRLLGETVTVAGLLTGRDIIAQLKKADLGEAVFVPSVALREGAFLDDVTTAELEVALGRPVVVVHPQPTCLARRIVGLFRSG